MRSQSLGRGCTSSLISLQVECQKCGFYFSKTRSQNIVDKNPYFKRVPLIEKRTQLTFPLIPLFSANKGIREDAKGDALLLRGLSQNKGFMKKRNELFFEQIAHFLQPTLQVKPASINEAVSKERG